MRTIVVGTDFSTRSDRAVRRASLLARQAAAHLAIVHAVDDDQLPRLVAAEQAASRELLQEVERTLREMDHLDCSARVVLGEPFAALATAAAELDADLLVMGPHRRDALRDVFVGTTVERTIRQSARPVLMANAVPTMRYRHLLVAVDLSEASLHALRAARELKLGDGAIVSVLYCYDAANRAMMVRASVDKADIDAYLREEEARATAELAAFLARADGAGARPMVRVLSGGAAETILQCARELAADLIVVGTRGRGGLERVLMGSVAERVLGASLIDVLAVPARARR